MTKKIVLALIFGLLIFGLLIFLLLRANNSATNQTGVNQPSGQSGNNFSSNYRSITQNEVNNLHWLDNETLTYTYYDLASRRKILAAYTNSVSRKLLDDNQIKLSEIFWSSRKELLIFDYGTPYTTYLFTNLVNLTPLNIVGYGYTWAPDGNRFFYINSLNEQVIPYIYTLGGQQTRVEAILPAFETASWNPKNDLIMLQSFDSETGSSVLHQLDLATNEVTNNILSGVYTPKWSPNGLLIGYISTGGVYVYSESGDIQRIYPGEEANNLAFQWIDDSRIIIYDGTQSIGKLVEVRIGDQQTKRVFSDFPLSGGQHVEIDFSPNGTMMGISTSKNGSWLISVAGQI